MIKLYDRESGKAIGEISEEQFDFLDEYLEEESAEDRDYYLNRTTLEMLEQQGADAKLMALLRGAMGEREEMEIRWEHAGDF